MSVSKAETTAINTAVANVLTKANLKSIDNLALSAAVAVAGGGKISKQDAASAETIGEAAAREYLQAHPDTTSLTTDLLAYVTNAVQSFGGTGTNTSTGTTTTTPTTTTNPATGTTTTTDPTTGVTTTNNPTAGTTTTTDPSTGITTTVPIGTAPAAATTGILATIEGWNWTKIAIWGAVVVVVLIVLKIFLGRKAAAAV